jgi:HAD superfamily hydrolase (TIGR01450 family)
MPTDLRRIRHVVLDLDGTLYRGARLFECTKPFLATLARLGIGRTFLTNNTSRSKADYVAKLRGLGIDAVEEEIYTPADSTIRYLREKHAGAVRLEVLGTPSLCRQMEEAGFEVGREAPQAVVVGFDTTLTYERLCRTAYWIAQGLPYIATHPDLVCPTDEAAVLVDCGSICAALNAATGRKPVVLGKPDPTIVLEVCTRHGLRVDQVAMAGDRLYTDVAMARRAGVVAVLVLSGEATEAEAAQAEWKPDLVLADVGELGRRLEAAISHV